MTLFAAIAILSGLVLALSGAPGPGATAVLHPSARSAISESYLLMGWGESFHYRK